MQHVEFFISFLIALGSAGIFFLLLVRFRKWPVLTCPLCFCLGISVGALGILPLEYFLGHWIPGLVVIGLYIGFSFAVIPRVAQSILKRMDSFDKQ